MDIQRFPVISQPFPEFRLVAPPTVTSGPIQLSFAPWLKPLVTPLVVGDGCPVYQSFVTNLTAAEIKLAKMQKKSGLKKF